jgi:hypothetical protein
MDETNLTGLEGRGERRPGFRAAAVNLPKIVGPIIARHGSGIVARIKAEWSAIVGPELAAATWPEALARGGTLKLRVAPAKALELQHRVPLVIERVNLFFGRAAVVRVALVQGPLPLPATALRLSTRALLPAEAAALEHQLGGIESPELRGALAGLGRRVIATPE